MSSPLPDPPRSSVLPPAPVAPLEAGHPPLAILVDYDGTIARTDVSDPLMAEFVTADWESHVADVRRGAVGLAPADGLGGGADHRRPRRAAREGGGPAARPGVPPVRGAGARGRASRSRWCRTGSASSSSLPSRRSASAGCRSSPPRRRSADGARIEFPNGNPDCFVCGTCKRNRVLAHQAAGRAVAFIGDGPSDRYAAGYSDIVFAKESLEQICIAERWPYTRWTSFTEIHRLAGPRPGGLRGRPGVARRPAAPPDVLRRRGLGPGPLRSGVDLPDRRPSHHLRCLRDPRSGWNSPYIWRRRQIRDGGTPMPRHAGDDLPTIELRAVLRDCQTRIRVIAQPRRPWAVVRAGSPVDHRRSSIRSPLRATRHSKR